MIHLSWAANLFRKAGPLQRPQPDDSSSGDIWPDAKRQWTGQRFRCLGGYCLEAGWWCRPCSV